DRLQAGQRVRHPVDVGQDLAFERPAAAFAFQDAAEARLGGLRVAAIDGDFPKARRLVDLDDGERQAVVLELGPYLPVEGMGGRVRRGEMETLLAHAAARRRPQAPARRLSWASALAADSP